MKKVEVSKKITIEFTEKELVEILTCLEDYVDSYFEWLEQSGESVSGEKEREVNNVRNLVNEMKKWI